MDQGAATADDLQVEAVRLPAEQKQDIEIESVRVPASKIYLARRAGMDGDAVDAEFEIGIDAALRDFVPEPWRTHKYAGAARSGGCKHHELHQESRMDTVGQGAIA
jgi:hypothetical protein